MFERNQNGPREGLDPPPQDAPEGVDEPGPAGAEEPIAAAFADSNSDQANNVRPFLDRVGPVFQAELADAPASPPVEPIPPRRARRVMLPVVLFLLTCLSTFVAGACMWWPADYLLAPPFAQDLTAGPLDSPLRRVLLTHWSDGLVYMACVLGILFTHEMGHFLATVRYRIPASFPFFLPFPIAPLGTLGAVIAMDGRRADRKQTFDIGIAGPLAGLVVALPVFWIGISNLDMSAPAHGMFQVEPPLIARWLLEWRQPPGYVPGDMIWQSQLNPFLMAGWFGLIITGVNMMPASQLDGGHVIYTLFGRRSRWIARGFIVLTLVLLALNWMLALDLVHQGLIVMVVMVMFIGVDHPPTSDDTVPLGSFRTALGYASLAIPFLCFAPRLFLTP